MIVTRPQSMKAMRGSDVRLECGVKADATTPVTTSWTKNTKEVTFNWRLVFLDTYYFKNIAD